jgi:hypothetical protein
LTRQRRSGGQHEKRTGKEDSDSVQKFRLHTTSVVAKDRVANRSCIAEITTCPYFRLEQELSVLSGRWYRASRWTDADLVQPRFIREQRAWHTGICEGTSLARPTRSSRFMSEVLQLFISDGEY